jgi:hypothetical protein
MLAVEPRLFKIAMSVPIPFTVFLSWAGVKLVRKLNRKIHKVNEVAAAGSINVLKEMVTVRQVRVRGPSWDGTHQSVVD